MGVEPQHGEVARVPLVQVPDRTNLDTTRAADHHDAIRRDRPNRLHGPLEPRRDRVQAEHAIDDVQCFLFGRIDRHVHRVREDGGRERRGAAMYIGAETVRLPLGMQQTKCG